MSKNKMSGEYLTAFAALHDDDTGVSETASCIMIAGQSAMLLPMVLGVDRKVNVARWTGSRCLRTRQLSFRRTNGRAPQSLRRSAVVSFDGV